MIHIHPILSRLQQEAEDGFGLMVCSEARVQSWCDGMTHSRVDASKATSFHPGCFTVSNLCGIAAREACCLLHAASVVGIFRMLPTNHGIASTICMEAAQMSLGLGLAQAQG